MSDTATPAQRAAAYLLTSRLLAYPDEALLAQLPEIRELTTQLTPAASVPLLEYLDAVEHRSLLDQQADYVSTFDLKRRCCLYLSYYLNGDTRRRGMALWRFQETYRRAGWSVLGGELPDYLPVLLEFAASGANEESAALALLHEHREGLEVLRAALARFGAPTELVITALIRLLPELNKEQLAAAQQLVASGPPTETVGLEPFGSQLLTIGARP